MRKKSLLCVSSEAMSPKEESGRLHSRQSEWLPEFRAYTYCIRALVMWDIFGILDFCPVVQKVLRSFVFFLTPERPGQKLHVEKNLRVFKTARANLTFAIEMHISILLTPKVLCVRQVMACRKWQYGKIAQQQNIAR